MSRVSSERKVFGYNDKDDFAHLNIPQSVLFSITLPEVNSSLFTQYFLDLHLWYEYYTTTINQQS